MWTVSDVPLAAMKGTVKSMTTFSRAYRTWLTALKLSFYAWIYYIPVLDLLHPFALIPVLILLFILFGAYVLPQTYCVIKTKCMRQRHR